MHRKGFGGPGEHRKGMRGDKRRGGRMMGLRGIELTDAQKEQIRVIHEANRPDESTKQELRTIAQAKRDGTITADQKERMKSLRADARQKGEAVRLQIEAILTPEQRQQIEARKLEMQKKMQERRQQRQERKTAPAASKDN
jgi:Spy/CpxP family protein refolding chaperone